MPNFIGEKLDYDYEASFIIAKTSQSIVIITGLIQINQLITTGDNQNYKQKSLPQSI